jgi:trimeric autotransporter adhesin
MAMEVGYFGSRSYSLTAYPTGTGVLPINEINPSNLSLGQAALSASVANPFYGIPGAAGVIATATVTRAQLLLPFPEYGTISENTALSHARYDSMVAKLQKRLSHGLTFLTTLTWSRNEDNEWASGNDNGLNGLGSAGTGGIQNIYNIGAEWALASSDTPVKYTASWTYQLPIGKGQPFLNNNKVLDYIAGGWSINGTAVISMGFPLYITQSNLNSGIGGLNQRPNATGISPAEPGGPEQKLNLYINPAAFTAAPADTYGNLSRNIPYLGPGMDNWDLSLFKTVSIKERVHAQFRAEALNAFNTPFFAPPYTNINQKTFGELNFQANLPRSGQLGLRISW